MYFFEHYKIKSCVGVISFSLKATSSGDLNEFHMILLDRKDNK